MKTPPQEQAEELAAKAAAFYHTLGMNVRNSIKESIPLPELIAVAMAAAEKDLGFDYRMNTPTDRKLRDAVAALRATGKVEL